MIDTRTTPRLRESQPNERCTGGEAPVDPFGTLLGESREHLEAVAACERLVASGARDVLLVGPPGSGKAHIARCMHNASPRAPEAFLTVDCGALSATALEADLFGRAAGMGSPYGREGLVQLAGAGTIFLRRIDLLPAELQPRILDVLRNRVARRLGSQASFDVRCAFTISAGPALMGMVDTGRFDRALYAHLARNAETLPSLRERRGDIEVLALHFLDEVSREIGYPRPTRALAAETLARLAKHKWPGNVRELRRAIRDAATRTSEPVIEANDLKLKRDAIGRRPTSGQIHIPAGTGKSLADIEAEAVAITLKQTAGNKSAAARMLGISRPRLQRKIELYGLDSTTRPV